MLLCNGKFLDQIGLVFAIERTTTRFLQKKWYLSIKKYCNFFLSFHFRKLNKKILPKSSKIRLFFPFTYILLKNSEKDPVLFLPLAFPFHFFSSNFSMMPKMINGVLEYEFITFFSCVRDIFSLRSIDWQNKMCDEWEMWKEIVLFSFLDSSESLIS